MKGEDEMIEKLKENHKLRFILAVAVLAGIGVLFLYVSEIPSEKSKWKDVLENIGIAFFFTGIFGLVQEFILKNTLVELIISKLKLKEDIERTGVESVYPDLTELNYRPLLSKATKHLDIYHVYGQTWTNTYIDTIEDRLLYSNCKIRVILVSPDSKFISGLAETYNGKTEDELKKLIISAAKVWKDLYLKKVQHKGKKTQSKIELYYHSGLPANSLYRIDDKIVYVQSKMTKGKSKRLSAYVCRDTKKTDLFDNYLFEIEALVNESEKVDWTSI